MSCGKHHDTDCSEVLLRAYEYLDGELDDVAAGERIRAHLEECRPCLQEYDVDRLLKAVVRRSCAQEQAPVALRTQIMTLIATAQVHRSDGAAAEVAVAQTRTVEVELPRS